MRLLDAQYTATPFYGSWGMQVVLARVGYPVNRKHMQRLVRTMGLEAVGPKPRLSLADPGHRVYPYLLRDVPITHVDRVWSTDITYVRLRHGFVYLVAIMDWFSRYVPGVARQLSETPPGRPTEVAHAAARSGDPDRTPNPADSALQLPADASPVDPAALIALVSTQRSSSGQALAAPAAQRVGGRTVRIPRAMIRRPNFRKALRLIPWSNRECGLRY
jgi:transposase InsO family protein